MISLVTNRNPRISLRILWVDFLILDMHLHKTSRLEILKHLAKRGHHVHLLALQSKKQYHWNSDIKITAIPLRYFPVISMVFFGIIVLVYLPFYIIRKKPDFIIVERNTPFFGFLWKPFLSRFLGFKVILDIRSTPVDLRKLWGYLKTLQFNISVRIAKAMFDGMTTISNGMRQELSKRFDIDPELIRVRSDGASTELFTYEENAHYGLKLRKRFGLSNKFIFFYHGALGRSRGVMECVKAIMLIKAECPDSVLFFLGSGPAARDIERLIQKNKIQDRVTVHTPVDYEDVPKYIAMCDVGIVPLPNYSRWRNQWPLKLLEYLAMKRPVIVTDIPANREIVGNNECAIYVPSSNPIQIARAMEFAYKNREKLKDWGELGREIIDQKHNWDEKAKDLENYLLEVKSRSSGW